METTMCLGATSHRVTKESRGLDPAASVAQADRKGLHVVERPRIAIAESTSRLRPRALSSANATLCTVAASPKGGRAQSA